MIAFTDTLDKGKAGIIMLVLVILLLIYLSNTGKLHDLLQAMMGKKK